VNLDFAEIAKTINADFQALTGLEFVQKMITHGDRSPMAGLLNMRVIAASDGFSQIEAVPSEKFYNPMMRVHGGFAATLIDSALGTAVLTKMPKGTGLGTVSLNVSFVRKIEVATGPVIATGTVLHVGRTMLTAECKVADRAGVLYAHGTGTFLVYPK
jgi:uncharacterized protein (TIGR00369 family)